ncbi:MAG: type II toxin-antitoxin system VapC family toxin [Candidatus Electrothrix sp. ATG1]|nr:type II toxin-antitoxin system VapC family toxin [Candidatus Electrothrix sp. ATG1]
MEQIKNTSGQLSINRMLISSITIAEICYGLRVLPIGQRRQELETRFEAFVAQGFAGRTIVFDESAARAYAEIMGKRKEEGRPMSLPDGQIAAVAQTNHLALATRNIRDFIHCGVELINPFE